MKINPSIANYKASTMPIKPENIEKKPVEDNKDVKRPNQDTVEFSSKSQPLTKKAIEGLQQQQSESYQTMIHNMLGKQANSSDVMNNVQSVLFKAGLGEITPEQAAFNVSEEGAYGVNAVATNIMDMAVALSGGDPDKFELLKDSVTKGFEAAGVDLGLGDKISDLPQVSQDTFTEVMKRFDHLIENGNLESYTYKPYDDERLYAD